MLPFGQQPAILDATLAAAVVLAVESHECRYPDRHRSVHYATAHAPDVLIGVRRDGAWDVAVYGVVADRIEELFMAVGNHHGVGVHIEQVRGRHPFAEWRPVVLLALSTVRFGHFTGEVRAG